MTRKPRRNKAHSHYKEVKTAKWEKNYVCSDAGYTQARKAYNRAVRRDARNAIKRQLEEAA